MCGFVILLKKQSLNSRVNKNLNKVFLDLSVINTHRGPDAVHIKKTKKNIILHRRLSIFDSNHESDQPFLNRDGKIKICYNGAIYNFLELKEELIKKGHKFKTESDTEVIMKSYQQYGLKFVKKLRGMFSLVIFDNNLNKTFIFRDPLGQKPLYYCKTKIGLILSSEIKDILYINKFFDQKILENNKTVFEYLLRGWTDSSNSTFYKNIFSFPAGCHGEIKNEKIKVKKYWNLKSDRKKIFNPDVFKKKFINNIKSHITPFNLPVAITLSGGIDSSLITETISRLEIHKFKAFSIKFRNNKSDEANKINRFIKKNKIKHEFCSVEKSYNSKLLSQVIDAHDEPIKDMSFINQFLLRKHIMKKGYKIVITGEGADEALGGYDRMLIPFIYTRLKCKNNPINELFKKNVKRYTGHHLKYYLKKIKDFKNLENTNHDIESREPLNFLKNKNKKIPNYLRFYNKTPFHKKNLYKNYLKNHLFKRDVPAILRHDDRNSMNYSIENRTPFLDSKFLEYVFSHNCLYFMKDGYRKYMLSSSFDKIFVKSRSSTSTFNDLKIGRPGMPDEFIKKNYVKQMRNLLKNNSIKQFSSDKILKQFNLDLTKSNSKNFIFYFRVLNYLLWKSQNIYFKS
tara:strand:- start:245 stop:2122 length:1878 start_codon:yes stop_codon:yes gene_type:complete